jgi:simple sugar transport system ATP-binding protein
LIITDEPTAALGVQEGQKVLTLIRELQRRGLAILVVSHSLEHVFAVADRVSVLRRGRVAGSRRKSETDRDEIVRLIVGGDINHAGGQPAPTTAKGQSTDAVESM